MTQEQKNKVLDFIKNQNLAVLATSVGDKPEAAVVDFSETDDLEIIFTTLISYRKYENLKNE